MPVAFFAVVSIGVIGLYVAFAIPIYLRWQAGDASSGQMEPGVEVQVDGPVAVVEIVITSIVALLPTSTGGGRVPRIRVEVRELHADRRSGALLLLWICWHVSVKNWFTGPKRTIDLPAVVVGGGGSGPDRVCAEQLPLVRPGPFPPGSGRAGGCLDQGLEEPRVVSDLGMPQDAEAERLGRVLHRLDGAVIGVAGDGEPADVLDALVVR